MSMLFEQLGMKFSLPYNFQSDFIDRVLNPFADATEEVYLSMYWAVASTARIKGRINSRREYLNMVDQLFKATSGRDIRLNFVANLQTGPRMARMITDEAVLLSDRYPGLCFTIHDLETAITIKREIPDADITPSTLSMVDSVVAAMYWRLAVNPKVLMIAREINRKPAILRQFKAMGFRVKMIPQDNCIPYCPVLAEHLNAISMRDELAATSTVAIPEKAAFCRPFAMGLLSSPDHAWMIAQQNLLPGHLRHIKGLVDIIKLEGRQLPTEQIRQKVEYYLKAESLQSYAPVLYTEPPEAWEKIANCERDCFRCDWCKENIRFNTQADTGQTSGPKVRRSITIAKISIKDGPVFLVFPLSSGLPAFKKAGRFGIAYQSDKLTDEIEAGARHLAEVMTESQLKHIPGLQVILNSPKIKQAFLGKAVTIELESRSLEPK